MTTPKHHGLWELAVLCFLRERPMHPYEMQRLLKERHKDEVLLLKRGSLYHAIGRLERAECIAPIKTNREGKRPERTTYQLTEAGARELDRWLRQLIAEPSKEPSEFMASVSFLVYLTSKDALEQLEARAVRLEREVEDFNAVLQKHTPTLERIHLIESDYARAMRSAELLWVRGVIAELRKGDLQWNLEDILRKIHGPDSARPEGERS